MMNLCEKVNLDAPEDLIGKWFKSITLLRVHLHTYGTTQDPLLILGHAGKYRSVHLSTVYTAFLAIFYQFKEGC